MSISVNSYLNSYYNPYSSSTSSSSGSSPIFDVNAAWENAQAQADSLLAKIKGDSGSGTVSALKTDTANYLNQYSASMKQLGQSGNNPQLQLCLLVKVNCNAIKNATT